MPHYDPELAKRAAREELIRRVTLLAVVLVLVAVCVVIAQIRTTQLSGSPIVKRTEELAKVIADCTQPTGECYQRSQRQTSTAVSSINEITVFAASCARQPENETATEIQMCVERLYEMAHPKG